MDIQIQTYWNVDTLYYVFNGIASIMMSHGWSGLMRFVFLLALAFGLFGYMGRQLDMAKWFIQALVFTTVLNLPVANVILSDRSGIEPPRTVAHVPVVLASVAQASTLVFGFLTSTYESAFGMPDELGLAKGDVGFGHRILRQVNSAVVRDPALRADLMQFFKECTKYDILDGVITADQIVGGTNTWDTVFGKTSPARFVTYNVLTNQPRTNTCTAVAAILKPRVAAAVTAAQRFYGRQAFTRTTSDAVATQMFLSSASVSYSWLLNASASASDAMKQAMFNNVWRDAGTAMARAHNDPAAIADTNALIAEAEAARQADGANGTLSLLGQETIPHMRNWIEAILYALFPVVVTMMVLVSTEAAKKMFAGYLMALAWIGLWPLLFAIINHLSLMHLRHKLQALSLAGGVPFQLSDVFDATIVNEQSMIGYMVVLVPFIAGAIVKLGDGQIYGLADRAVSGVMGMGSRTGAAIAAGNYSMGQAGIDTASVNTTTMQKYDSDMAMNSGMTSMQLADGSTLRVSSNGRAAIDKFQSHMMTSMLAAEDRALGQNREQFWGDTSTSGWSSGTRSGTSVTGSETFGHSNDRGTTQNIGQEVSRTDSGSTHGRYDKDEGIQHSGQARSSFDQSIRASDTVRLQAGAQGELGGGVNVSGEAAPAIGGNKNAARRVKNAMQEGGASPEQIDNALKNVEGKSSQAGKGSSAGLRVGASVNAGAGLQADRTYSAGQVRDHSSQEEHKTGESASEGFEYLQASSVSSRTATGEQSAQSDRHDRSASQTTTSDTWRQTERGAHRESGTRGMSSANDSLRHEVMRNMMADPELFWKVAQRNGMSSTRFILQSEDKIVGMVGKYLDDQAIAQNVRQPSWNEMQERTPMPSGGQQHGVHGEVHASGHHEGEPRKRQTSRRSNAQFDALTQGTGFQSVEPLQPDMARPGAIDAAKATVHRARDPQAPESLGQRAREFDQDVQKYASPDRALGEGRVTQTEVNAANEGRDMTDTGRRAANAVRKAVGVKPNEDFDKSDVPPKIKKD